MQSSTARDNYLCHGSQDGHSAEAAVVAHRGGLAAGEPGPPVLAAGPRRPGPRPLVDAQAVVAHMLAVIDREAAGDLAQRVSAVYEFIYRSLVKAGHRHDEKGLADAVRILEIERETWRQVCEKLAVNAPHARFADGPHGVPDSLAMPGGFSVEA